MSRVPEPLRLVPVLALAALLAACATQEPQHHHRFRREGGEGPGRGGGASLFVSPAGEPFRAGAGDAYPVGRWFAQVDANHDGRVTAAEFRADAERYFHVLDLNGDGVIDGSEITAYEHTVLPEILAAPSGQARADGSQDAGGGGQGGGWGGGRHGGGGGGGGGGMGHHRGGQGAGSSQASAHTTLQGAAPYSLNRQAEPVSSADANFDGKVTLAEFLAAADRHFAELDTQGTGYLTLDTLPKTVAQERAQRRAADHD